MTPGCQARRLACKSGDRQASYASGTAGISHETFIILFACPLANPFIFSSDGLTTLGGMLSRVLQTIAAILVFMPLMSGTAMADQCSAAARKLVGSQSNATLLSVQMKTRNNGKTVCIVRMKIDSGDGKPPRVVVRRVNP